jgi:hypothetical protein
VEIARSEAVEAARLGRWADALLAIDKAIVLESTWADLYLLRAGIHVGNAGPESDEASLQRLRLTVDYEKIVIEFATAAADWTKYLELGPAAKERKTLVRAIGEYRALANVAKGHAVTKTRFAAQSAAYAAGTPATCYDGRVLVDGIHCCWPAQQWTSNGCLGQCPAGFTDFGYGRCAPIVRTARGTSPRCPEGQSVYEYRPEFWDEDVESVAHSYDSRGQIALLEMTRARVAADQCHFSNSGGGSRGLACCP